MAKGTSKAGKVTGNQNTQKKIASVMQRIKEPTTKQDFIDKMEVMAEIGNLQGIYNYTVQTSDWENYGKSRTYFKIKETRAYDGKTHGEMDYGYYDNKTNKYVKSRSNDLDTSKFYSISGSSVEDSAIKYAVSAVLKRKK